MKSYQALRFFPIIMVAAALGAGSLTYAQETVAMRRLSFSDAVSSDGQTQSTGQPSPTTAAAADDGWHLVVAPYLWFPGVHGAVGARDREVGVHASPGDLLSDFRFGLLGFMEARHKRLVLPLDVMWVRLGDSKALPFPNLSATTADVKINEFILTPKIGVQVIDQEKIKIDALTGFRYWHLGQELKFSPSPLGLNFSGSVNWVDPLVGGRIQAILTPKLDATIAGDVGGWGTGSELEYQVVGLLGYKIKPKTTLQVGYRYLDVDYRSNLIFDAATSGVVFGVSIQLK